MSDAMPSIRVLGRLHTGLPVPFGLVSPGVIMTLPDIPTHFALSLDDGPLQMARVVGVDDYPSEEDE